MLSRLEESLIKKEETFCSNTYNPLPVVLKKGRGVYVWDVHCKKYFDFLSSYSAVNQGHCNKKILRAFTRQARKLTLTSRAFYNSELGDSLEYITSAFGYDKMLPMNSGAEAVETAIKICRKWGHEIKKIKEDSAKIVVCDGNFHGRTTTVVSFSPSLGSKKNFGPLTPGFEMIKYNDIEALEKVLKKDKNIAGFLVEPIQGEGGVVVPDDGYLKKCKKLCEDYNVLFIADEIQTGVCRTGKLLASWHEEIKPDMVILGKALSAGFYPVSGVLTSKEIMSVMKVGQHGSTFGGNPLAGVVAKASIKYAIDYKLAENAQLLGEIFRSELIKISSKRKIIKGVRGKGLLNAIILDCDSKSKIPWNICLKMRDNGLLAKPTQGNKIRFAPPLVITKRQLFKAINIIDSSLSEF
jgi:ornithine--oxo-acid transaminase|tara:strand:+ start:958 stop:2187 length:1230 start_codon:yes stop_codon:yes gene_type:complete